MSQDVAAAPHSSSPGRWTVLKRGLKLRCPVCGEGKLFRSYLKLADRCSCCGASLGTIRADDGPAWLTILVVGHLVVPFFLLAVRADAPNWIYFGVLGPITLALTVLLLPVAKGFFAALLWSMGMPNGVPNPTPAPSRF